MTKDKGAIDPKVVLYFLSENPEEAPTRPADVAEDIFRARLILWHETKRRARYTQKAKDARIPKITEATLQTLLKGSTQKKYRDRPSPSFSANSLCGATLKGNDGVMYKSVKNTKGVCSWKLA